MDCSESRLFVPGNKSEGQGDHRPNRRTPPAPRIPTYVYEIKSSLEKKIFQYSISISHVKIMDKCITT